MNHSEIINKIIEFADKAHGDQTRKYTSDKYIVHPIRVMETCNNILMSFRFLQRQYCMTY